MEQSSYLFRDTRNYRNIFTRIMEKRTMANSNMSIDSLEISQDLVVSKTKPVQLQEEPTETILVPFYENDVLIKIPKKNKPKQHALKNSNKCENSKYAPESVSYLVNRNKNKRPSYLEMFQKQLHRNAPRKEEPDIRSISPEFGDTDIGSVSECANSSALDFYNTEAYNEIYYEKLLHHVVESFENSLDDGEVTSKSLEMNNLKSVSEVTPPPRRARRTTVLPIQYVKLGGLGPDMEQIKPRLERARSLQRYSEKVRMENRLKIYKLTLEEEEKRKAERDTPRKRIEAKPKEEDKKGNNASYLMNNQNAAKKKPANKPKTILSAVEPVVDGGNDKAPKTESKTIVLKPNTKNNKSNAEKIYQKATVTKSKNKSINDANSKGIKNNIVNKLENNNIRSESPIDNYLTCIETDRNGSSTLRSLEEKHRMFQEQVKGFTFGCRN
ncbi:uncharacterized protein LOC125490969 [Plutella xylostella]|uniref:uncharacterized protein LOC125490969 n=1 Tax=Plutella xylostella TaxID=51655 RepID=UPI00203286C8|nr:uncharacterized protein LOC125490969 [Plutella xylostella]